METRELYKQKIQAQIHEWAAKLDVMKAQTEGLSAQAKIDAKPHLDAIHAKLDAAKAMLDEIGAVSNDAWNELVEDLDVAWADVKAAADAAIAALKRHHDA